MKEILKDKRRMAEDAVILIMGVIGIAGLLFVMDNIGGMITFKNVFDVFHVVWFRFRFRWAALLIMLSTLLLQLTLYASTGCRTKWKMIVWAIGPLFYIRGWNLCDTYLVEILLKRIAAAIGTEGIGLIIAWECANEIVVPMAVMYVMVIFFTMWILVHDDSITMPSRAQKGIGRVVKVIALLLYLILFALLTVNAFSDLRYPALCLLCSLSTWFILDLEKNIWNKLFPYRERESIVLAAIDKICHILGIADEVDDTFDEILNYYGIKDNEEDCSEVNDNHLTNETLDLLLDYADRLKEEGIDEKERWEKLTGEIKNLRDTN